MAATEAIKMLTGMGRPLIGRVAFVDVLGPSVREVVVRPGGGRRARTGAA